MIVVAFDPGFQHTGFAVFDTTKRLQRVDMVGQMAALAESGSIDLRKGGATEANRLGYLFAELDTLLTRTQPARVVVEKTYAGVHRGRRGRQRMGQGALNAEDMRWHSAAFGVVLAAADLRRITPLYCDSTLPKAARQDAVRRACERAGVPIPSNEHARDAAWTGTAAYW